MSKEYNYSRELFKKRVLMKAEWKKLYAPLTKKEMANEYGCSTKTIARHFQAIGINTKKMLFQKQIDAYAKAYGAPSGILHFDSEWYFIKSLKRFLKAFCEKYSLKINIGYFNFSEQNLRISDLEFLYSEDYIIDNNPTVKSYLLKDRREHDYWVSIDINIYRSQAVEVLNYIKEYHCEAELTEEEIESIDKLIENGEGKFIIKNDKLAYLVGVLDDTGLVLSLSEFKIVLDA